MGDVITICEKTRWKEWMQYRTVKKYNRMEHPIFLQLMMPLQIYKKVGHGVKICKKLSSKEKRTSMEDDTKT